MDTTPISNQALLEIQMKSKILCYLTIHKYNHWCRSMLGGLQLYRECLRCGKKWIHIDQAMNSYWGRVRDTVVSDLSAERVKN